MDQNLIGSFYITLVLFLSAKICNYFLFVSLKSFERRKPFILVTFTKHSAISDGPFAQWHSQIEWFYLVFTLIRLSIGYDAQLDNRKYLLVECRNLDMVSCPGALIVESMNIYGCH